MINYKTLINGKMLFGDKIMEIKSPINGDVLGTVPALGKKDIDYAFVSATKAFANWSSLTPKKRISYILAFKKELEKNKELLAKILTLEISKSHKDCLDEINRSIKCIDLIVEEYQRSFIKPMIVDEKVHGVKNKTAYIYKVPLGVVLAISPFNYPINLSLNKIIPALILGNCVVFKPATQGAISALVMAQLFYNCKFPNGTINFVTGKGSEIGDHIITNKQAKMISFTGGIDVGKKIMQYRGDIPTVLELGGKDAAIVLEDADLEIAVNEITKGAFNYSGQRCTATKIVYVHEKIADRFVSQLKEKVLKLKIGNPIDNVDICPVIDNHTVEYAKELIADAKEKRAKIVIGNKFDGNIIFPTILDNVNRNMKIFNEEQFCPILPIMRFNKIRSVINLVNLSPFGLQSSIYTNNIDKYNEIAFLLNVGTINLNKSSSRGPDILPFLGVKDSGKGVQGIYWSLDSMSRIKVLVRN